MKFKKGFLTINGEPIGKIKEFNTEIDNNLTYNFEGRMCMPKIGVQVYSISITLKRNFFEIILNFITKLINIFKKKNERDNN